MMDMQEAMRSRHSVRKYTRRKIEGATLQSLQKELQECNEESGLRMQLCLQDPAVFRGFLAHYGRFRNVENYIAIVGKNEEDLQEKAGYYGERVVLKATQLGLQTCWAALTYRKRKLSCRIQEDEKLVCVIAIGYGETMGNAHKSRTLEEVSDVSGSMPSWFRCGMEAVLLAPTALNQQKFCFQLRDTVVSVKPGNGNYTEIDMGIAKYHFEQGADSDIWSWG